MSEENNINEAEQDIQRVQDNLEEEVSMTDGASETCPICKHPSSKELTKIYLENNKSISAAKAWFYNKFKRTYSERTWEKHFREHVDPFLDSYDLVRQKKLDELIERSSDLKRDSAYNPTSVIKQIIMEMLIDGYSYKPKQLYTKEEQYSYNQLVKSITALSKTYQQYHQMDLDSLGFGKTEEEQIAQIKDYMTNMAKNALELLDKTGDVEQVKIELSRTFGIAMDSD